jgi:hypothetical protein
VQKFLADELKPTIVSEPIPEQQGLVKKVVAENWNEIVMDPNNDVLLEAYAPCMISDILAYTLPRVWTLQEAGTCVG